MTRHDTVRRLVAGAGAGLAGSALIQGLQVGGQKLMPREMPPVRREPGEYMVEKGEELLPPETREKIPETLEKAAAKALGLGYGTTFALLFAASRPRVQNLFIEGSVLGLVTWAAGYLGWLPATRLMPPVTRQKPGQVAGGIASHIVFGIATAALYRRLRQLSS